MSATNRLALLVNADGTRWVTRVDERRVPKTLVRDGKAFTTLMTMDPKHIDWAQAWLWDAPNKPATSSVALGERGRNIVAASAYA